MTVRRALAALLVLTGAAATATLPTDIAPRTVVQAEPETETTLPPRDEATQRLADEMTVAWEDLKVEVAP